MSAVQVYLSSTNETAILTTTAETGILSLMLCNQSSATVVATVHLQCSATTSNNVVSNAGVSNSVAYSVSIPAQDTLAVPELGKWILDTGSLISCVAGTANAVTATCVYRLLPTI